ncbi:glycosyltransferase family 2 protein [Vibrio campbellii]|uniref:glycosyltransferase family 2 protein n=1 Tax=Vibrio campbellii TaxID=680 RepID=UPI00210BD772|nr:glycosyltransferase [Vibrio campbellii]UTZ40106.1 glycosyltransferase [Vibrio campbellii]
MTPEVSVILPVYNAEAYLAQAIDSILSQTFSNLELVVVNDGSTDGSQAIIEQFANQDARVKAYSRENQGLVATLNELLAHTKAPFIARMDADDIAMPNRIERQLSYLKSHTDVALVGTGYRYLDSKGNLLHTRRTITHPGLIAASFLLGNPIAHPTVMFNRQVCGKALYYDDTYKHAEDFELWIRLCFEQELKVSNLNEILLHYRVHEQSTSSLHNEMQRNMAVKAIEKTVFGRAMLEQSIDPGVIYQRSPTLLQVAKLSVLSFRLSKQLKPLPLALRMLIAVVKPRKDLRSSE